MRNLLLAFLLFCTAVPLLNAQYPPELAPYTTPFGPLTDGQFSFLDDHIRDATIIGIGEATHGTAEFTQLTGELFLYLVDHHNVRLLIIEDAFGEVRRINEYVAGRREKPELWEGNWRYYTEEFTDLLDALRTYNLTHPDDPVAIYGPEMQYVKEDAAYLEAYFNTKQEDAHLRELLEFATVWMPHTTAEVANALLAVDRAEKLLAENEKAWSMDAEYAWAAQHLNVIRQFVTTSQQRTEQRKHDFRELFMLENIQWLLRQHGPNTKALFWAHNAHIRDGHDLNGNTNSIGQHLRRIYGDDYFAITTTFGTGSFLAYPADANQTGWYHDTITFGEVNPLTVSHGLDEKGSPNAYLNLRAAGRNPDMQSFFEERQLITGEAGAQFWGDAVTSTRLREADGLIYLEKSSPLHFIGSRQRMIDEYVAEYFVSVQPRALNTQDINWADLRAKAKAETVGIRSLKEVHEVLKAITPLINKHSFFIAPSDMKGVYGEELAEGEFHPQLVQPSGEVRPDGIAYLTIPAISFAHLPSLNAYADSLQQLIARLDGTKPSGWVVDLRENVGGNCWPMLAGLGPLLGEGTCGYFMTPEGENAQAWSYKDGASRMSGSPQTQTTDYQLRSGKPRIAVLTSGETASAGEVVAVAFRAMDNVRSFGEPTRGYSTTNTNVILSDEAVVILTVSVYADRDKQAYGEEIVPDVVTEDGVGEAVKWLLND